MAYNVCLLKGNGLLLHHKLAESKSTAPFLCNSWIMAQGTELGPFSSPEAIHFGWGECWWETECSVLIRGCSSLHLLSISAHC